MRYLAILKDSLREALDSKVLVVLLLLSTAVIGLIAGFSFKPLSAEHTMRMFFATGFDEGAIPGAINSHKLEKILAKDPGIFGGKFRPPGDIYQFESVELLRGEADHPESDYAMILSQPNFREGQPPPGGDNDPKAPLAAVRAFFKDAEDLGFIRVESVEYVAKVDAGMAKRFRVVLAGTPRTHRIWASELGYFSYTVTKTPKPLGDQIYGLSKLVLGIGSWVAVLAGIVITSFFIPNMLNKGTIDLLLVKPIQRWLLLTYKYIGGLAFIFLATAYAVGGVWLVFGLRSGIWANGCLLLILTITFFFAVLYALSTFVAVMTRSAITAIIVTVVFWFVFFVVGRTHTALELVGRIEKELEVHGHVKPPEERWGEGNIAKSVRILHFVTPHTDDLNSLNDLAVFTSFMTGDLSDMKQFDTSQTNWTESTLVSLSWIFIFMGLSVFRFSTKDY